MILKIAGAGAGAFAGNWIVTNFVFKNADGTKGFIAVEDGVGLDDLILWVGVGLGAYFGMALASKVGG